MYFLTQLGHLALVTTHLQSQKIFPVCVEHLKIAFKWAGRCHWCLRHKSSSSQHIWTLLKHTHSPAYSQEEWIQTLLVW